MSFQYVTTFHQVDIRACAFKKMCVQTITINSRDEHKRGQQKRVMNAYKRRDQIQ